MNISIHPAQAEDLAIAKNLVPYYVYDMSEFASWPCSPEGKFDGCDMLPTYWEEEGKHAYMLKSGEEIAGFALVRGNHEEEDIDYSIGEFFILRKFRGKGQGEKVARELFDMFHGNWFVAQLASNKTAIAFWRKVIDRYSAGKYQEEAGESPWGDMNEIRFSN